MAVAILYYQSEIYSSRIQPTHISGVAFAVVPVLYRQQESLGISKRGEKNGQKGEAQQAASGITGLSPNVTNTKAHI